MDEINLEQIEFDGRFVAKCNFMGKEINLLVDTGSTASRIGVMAAQDFQKKDYYDKKYVEGELKIQDCTFGCRKLFLEDENFNLSAVNDFLKDKYKIDGLLGMDFLTFVPYTLDFRSKPGKGCLNSSRSGKEWQKLDVCMPETLCPQVHVKVGNHCEWMLLDTGATHVECDQIKREVTWEIHTMPNCKYGTSNFYGRKSLRYFKEKQIELVGNPSVKIPKLILSNNPVIGVAAFEKFALHYDGKGNYYIARKIGAP